MSCARHTAKHKGYSCVAQLAERSTVNRMVAGSSPAAGAINHRLRGGFLLYEFLRLHMLIALLQKCSVISSYFPKM